MIKLWVLSSRDVAAAGGLFASLLNGGFIIWNVKLARILI